MDVTFTRANRWYRHRWAEYSKKMFGLRWFTAWGARAEILWYGCLPERGVPWGYMQLRTESMLQSHSTNRKLRSQSVDSVVMLWKQWLVNLRGFYSKEINRSIISKHPLEDKIYFFSKISHLFGNLYLWQYEFWNVYVKIYMYMLKAQRPNQYFTWTSRPARPYQYKGNLQEFYMIYITLSVLFSLVTKFYYNSDSDSLNFINKN